MSQIELTKEDVIDAENKLFAAQLVSDIDVLDQLLHDDLIAVSPTEQILTKEMDLNAHKAKLMVIEDASIEIEEVKIIDDTAVSIVAMKAKEKMMNTPV